MPHILIISADFYEDISAELLKGATQALEKAGATHDHYSVPGALEIPAAIRMGMESQKYDGFVALGCVIRGETSHYDTVCKESARGLNDLATLFVAPIGNGILTVENREQAMERALASRKNKGGGAVEACLAMINLKHKFLGKGTRA